ncbi:3-deoxy-D-manno-octulosonic acid transferase [Nitrospira sp. BLG_2]|uniref:3-deoxy-D-manno-octulosonic acid transferase n=1 Tax=Nitrospira sp. BLG_2 TaxID=3397507 RepID=UPI003B9B1F80
MWKLLYNIGLLFATPVIVGVLLAKPRCRPGFFQRMGRQRRSSDGGGTLQPLIWVHAVSLGEVVAAAPLVKALHERHPEFRYIVTTVTETGREAVEQRLGGIAEHRYAPLDFPWAVAGVVRRLRPMLYVFVETEIWPNLLWTLRDQDVPSVLVNGRLSSRSFRRQDLPVIRSFYRSVLQTLTLCLMQSQRDGDRLVALGADSARVHVTGNIKFDQPLPSVRSDELFRRSVGIDEHEQLILAGSTHPGEEELLVSAYRRIVKTHPSAVLMLAPRHIERADRVEATLREAEFVVQRRSRIREKQSGPRVIILDTRGELSRAYREAVVAFVGGTLVPVGGHNLLEPAVWGTPVLFGPHTDHCAEVATLLSEAGGGRRVAGVEDLVATLEEWLGQPEIRYRVGQSARQAVLDNQGALTRSLELIETCLRPDHSYSDSCAATGPGPLMAKT